LSVENERQDANTELAVGHIDDYVRRAVQSGELAADRSTFMQLIIGRTPARERTDYKLSPHDERDVYFVLFNALRTLDLSAAVSFGAINRWVRDNVVGPKRPNSGQIGTALADLKTSSRELVREAQQHNRSREQPIEWYPNYQTLFVNDPFLKLYNKYGDWTNEYRKRHGTRGACRHKCEEGDPDCPIGCD